MELPQDADHQKQALGIAKALVATLEPAEEVVMRWGFEVEVPREIPYFIYRLISFLAWLAASMFAPRYVFTSRFSACWSKQMEDRYSAMTWLERQMRRCSL